MSNVPSTIHSLFYFNKEQSANILQILGKYMYRKAENNIDDSVSTVPFSYVAPSISSMSHHYDLEVEPALISGCDDEVVEDDDNVETVDNVVNETIVQSPNSIVQSPNSIVQSPNPISNIEYHYPKQQDTLFWCIFIAVHGYDEYLQVSRNYGVKELEVKQKVSKWLQTNLSKMKNTNIKVTKVAMQEIMSELITSVKETSIMAMLAMITHFNINVILVDSTGALMLDFKADRDNDLTRTFVLQKDSFGKYKIRTDSFSKEQAEEFKKPMVCLESHLRPLKPITNYQTDELKTLARRLGGFDENYKYKKAELYEELTEAMRWK
uniref:Uncharacterized protein n=1 Tax=viral metagenome TaxID=1070528 RepID=A0A6C0JJ71_9ZZZZ